MALALQSDVAAAQREPRLGCSIQPLAHLAPADDGCFVLDDRFPGHEVTYGSVRVRNDGHRDPRAVGDGRRRGVHAVRRHEITGHHHMRTRRAEIRGGADFPDLTTQELCFQ